MNTHHSLSPLTALLLMALLVAANAVAGHEAKQLGPAGRTPLNDGWLFRLDTGAAASRSPLAGLAAQPVTLPHDWAREGDFAEQNPAGCGGGALPGGIGWYDRDLFVAKGDRGHTFRLTFDGAYMNSTVWINGHELGTRPFGYISFTYDLTPYLRYGRMNHIRVRVDNSDQPNSRWYSGCGLFRPVWLTKSGPVHFADDGIFITPSIDGSGQGQVTVKADIVNPKSQAVKVTTTIVDAQGREVATGAESLTVEKPQLWDVETPYLYTAITRLLGADGQELDEVRTRIGFRTFSFTPEGFTLNGRHQQIQGVCLHHDLGCLGSAVNRRAIERQLVLLRQAGINGIRCSHNPPSRELLDLCDEMGFLVMDEAFDMWRKKKTANDYAKYFNAWHERDLNDFIKRDRNHPCILLWSIGNEVLEQWTHADADTLSLAEANLILNFGHAADASHTDQTQHGAEAAASVNALLTRKLATQVRSLDTTRPITAGCNEPAPSNHLFRSGALDIIGYNYHNQNIADVPRLFPGQPFIITESNSALMTRGYYRQSMDSTFVWPERWDKPFADATFSCSAYENCHVPWGNSNEENLLLMRRYPWICGQYVWTGFDYLGEPTPYWWPARSSFFGFIDLAGFPKDSYYLYQAELTDTPVLHLLPHWNFGSETFAGPGIEPSRLGKDGMVDVCAYYNQADSVELFLNGRSLGFSSKTGERLHAQWRVHYEPGTLLAVARRDGRVVNSMTVRTAGCPARLRLTPDRRVITANGEDLSFVTVEVIDSLGTLCPNATDLVSFTVTGNATIAGVDNGSPISRERFTAHERHAFYGKCLVVVRNDGTPGTATLTATAPGLRGESVEIIAN